MKTFIHALCAGIFWIWNLCFLLLVYFGILPTAGFNLLLAMVDGTIPLPFVISLTGILVIPPLCTFLGGWRLRKHPVLLMRLFYGIEAPLFGLCLLRLFLLRETTPASTFLLVVFGLAIATFTTELFFGYAADHKPLAWFQMVTHSLVLMSGLYVGGLLLFYTVPALCVALFNFIQMDWLGGFFRMITQDPIGSLFWGLLALSFMAFSCTLFLAMPYVLVNVYLHSWGRIFSAFGRQHGRWKGIGVTGGVAIATLLLFIQTQAQPQVKAFELLDPPPQTEIARQAVLAQSDVIRAGLTNAYLHAYRYLSPWQESNGLRDWYQTLFDLTPDQAQFWQDWHNRFLSPFLYQGGRSDDQRAAKLYAHFFDQSIQKGERQAIQHALQSTVNREETRASLLNINQEIVYLARQEVTVKPQGDRAEISLFERYENNTDEEQEIFYSFSLPESAVITGLWLGDDLTPQTRYPFVVSPRGAAQKVYNAEVDRGQRQPATDPALLEQVGPRQYRLRVFPIPRRNTAEGRPGRTDLWLTYQVMQQAGQWPLPQLTEKRSLYWNRDTVHLRQGQTVTLPPDQWFETAIPAQKAAKPQSHTALLAGYRVTAEPVAQPNSNLRGQRVAVVVDTSYSMAHQQSNLAAVVRSLQRLGSGNSLDWYLAASGGQGRRADAPVRPEQITFYGSLQLSELLQQFENLATDREYDAILLVTDQGSYELAQDSPDLPVPNAPLWVLHLGGQLPQAYEDTVLQAIQDSQGGVATHLDEVLQRLATQTADRPISQVIDGYQWRVEPSTEDPTTTSEAGFTPMAARQLIRQLSRDEDMTQVAALDRVHAIAQQTAIVTPYSSMLVLVDERQREALRQAELAADRFDRQVEDGNDQLTQPGNPLHNPASVPEPTMGLALALVAGSLLGWRQQRPVQKDRSLL